jgi:hypothetical protein
MAELLDHCHVCDSAQTELRIFNILVFDLLISL